MKTAMLTLASYHAWATDVLYSALQNLEDADYGADQGLFFRSVHGTLNHLLVADHVWYGRCVGPAPGVQRLDAELETDRERLQHALRAATRRWAAWLSGLDEAALLAPLRYRNLSGAAFEQPLVSVLHHVFNHGTHHRGQISTAISQAGLAAPEMDLLWYLRRDAPVVR